jgi:acetyl-CoA carboxylase carboxyltransferase component
MSWQPEIDELNHRKELAAQMGGTEAIAKHHARGKLTARERISLLCDPGSFRELGELVGSSEYDENNNLVNFVPKPIVLGFGNVDGRRVLVSSSDFTIRGGSVDAILIALMRIMPERIALDARVPYIRLLDATGGSVKSFEQIGRTYLPENPAAGECYQALNSIPVVSAVMGSVAGHPAVQACLAHYSVMVKKTSQVFVAGPPVVKAALGYDITKEDLGNEMVHTYKSGVIDNAGDTEEQTIQLIKRFLSYLPSNVNEMAPYVKPDDDPSRKEDKLLSFIPRNSKVTYDAHKMLEYILDKGSIFDIAPNYGQSRITALARVNGYPVGLMCNDPRHLGGSMDDAATNKVTRFLQMCNTFHLPIVYFADEPGFMVGLESEQAGTLRLGARLICVSASTRVPWMTIVTRQLFGVAGGLHYRPGGMYVRCAWPSARWGSMHIEGGVMAAFRREIETSADPEATRKYIEERIQVITSPFRTAEYGLIEKIIDPRETRAEVCDFVNAAQVVLKEQLGPTSGPSFIP